MNTPDFLPEPRGYQVDDLLVDLAPRRVRRAGTAIKLQALSFDLLVVLARAAPNLVSFDQLSERVWPGLVVAPETIVQRVKLLRDALGDDSHAPRYIEGVRGRGYRMVAEVRPLTQGHSASELIGRPTDKREEEISTAQSNPAIPGAVPVSSPASAPSTARTPVRALGAWIGAALIVVAALAALWTITRYRAASTPAESMTTGDRPVPHSLVVLPLENLSGDKEQEYFADGVTDALTTDLAQIASLRVISRTSAMQLKDSKKTVPQIGRDLQVDAVVEGTVTRGGNRVRVTAQLVEVSGDRHLWAKTYERDLQNVLALQDELAQDITEQIRVKLTPKERSLLMQVHTVDPEAYDATLRGWYWWNQLTADSNQKALDYFQKAVAKDPRYAPAYAGVAQSFLSMGFGGGPLHRDAAFLKAREAATKALELDSSIAEAHTTLALIKLFVDWNWSDAEAEYKQAIALNPNYASAHFWYSNYLLAMGRLDEALNEADRAQDLDPFSLTNTWWPGQVLYHARRYDDALRQNRRGLEMHPNSGIFYHAMADIYEQKKMFAEAFAARQQAKTMERDPNVATLAEAYKHSGYRGYLLKEAQILEPGQSPAYAAHVYSLLNDEGHAVAALEVSYDQHDGAILFMRTAPELDFIRSSPRFRDLVRRIGFPQPPGEKN